MSANAARPSQTSHLPIADENGRAQSEKIFAEIARCEAAAVEVRGGAAAGKSRAILERTLYLLRNGTPAASIFIACSTLDAARALERRFASLCRARTLPCRSMPTFCTPGDLMRAHLDSARAHGTARPAARVLLDVEVKLLARDLLARGYNQAAIRQALDARRAGLGPFEKPDSLKRDDDAEIHRAVQHALEARNAILREDIPSLCAKSDATTAFPYLLIDDADTLSPSVLAALASLAGRQCMVTSSSPCTKAMGARFDLGEVEGHTDAFVLAAAFKRMATKRDIPENANVLRPSPAGDGSAIALKWRDPQEEAEGIALFLQRMLRDDGTLAARDVYIAVPNETWAEPVKQALHRRFLEASVALGGQGVSGDPRSRHSGARLQALTRLNLIVDLLDVASWRNFCAFRRKDFASEEWNQLEDWARSRGTSAAQVISEALSMQADQHILPEAPRCVRGLLTSMASTAKDLAQHEGKRGFDLAKAIGRGLDAEALDGFFGSIAGDEDAAALREHLWSTAFEESFSPSLGKVRIGGLERLAGLSPRILVIAGFNDGLYEADPARGGDWLYGAVRKTRDLVMLSFVQKLEHELAAKMGCAIRRTKHERGVRLAMLAPSPLLTRIGDCAPGQQSGQQFLGEMTGARR